MKYYANHLYTFVKGIETIVDVQSVSERQTKYGISQRESVNNRKAQETKQKDNMRIISIKKKFKQFLYYIVELNKQFVILNLKMLCQSTSYVG